MEINFSEFIKSLFVALDYAEKALLDVSPLHGLRVAVLTNEMANYLGLPEEIVRSATQAALLHDCALAEYFSDEFSEGDIGIAEDNMSSHCIAGEKILRKLPFYRLVPGAVLYHHDCADGSGALGKTSEQTPLYAQLIHTADAVDVRFSLYTYDAEKYSRIRQFVKEKTGTLFSEKCADAFLSTVTPELLQNIAGDAAESLLDCILPSRTIDISLEALRETAEVFAAITDYKSRFTVRHSMGIAEKAETIGRFYGLSADECNELYISGALHDIGKLLIDNEILEKPGKLSPDEYKEVQNHAIGTWNLLRDITGMEKITRWASLHHEKLDGSGYPFGYTADELDKNSRLMACLDIYQALVEKRPYKDGLSHGESMEILRKMGASGQLDKAIIEDIDACFAEA